jgi:hypothetical protein
MYNYNYNVDCIIQHLHLLTFNTTSTPHSQQAGLTCFMYALYGLLGWYMQSRSTALRTKLRHRSSVARLAAWPMMSSAQRARVMPTLMRRSSATKPMDRLCTPAVRTQLKMTMSFSRPCR